MSDYRPHIYVEDGVCPHLHPIGAAAVLFPPLPGTDWIQPPPPEMSPDCWQLIFIGVDGDGQIRDFDGHLSRAQAVAAAQDYLLKHGQLRVDVQVQSDEPRPLIQVSIRGPEPHIGGRPDIICGSGPLAGVLYAEDRGRPDWILFDMTDADNATVIGHGLSEAEAVYAAQEHLLKHGRRHVEVEVHLDE